MKLIKLVFILFILNIVSNISTAQELEKIWETSRELATPESVIYDVVNDILYVSNVNGDPSEKDGNGFISKISTSGEIKTLKWAKGLNAPKGMAISQGKLYVADLNELIEIDLKNGKILNKYATDKTNGLNDVTISINGVVYVSDAQNGVIYALDNDEFSIWNENTFNSLNGILANMGKLLLGGQSIYEMDISTREAKEIFYDTGGVDGLEMNESGNIIFSNYQGKIFIENNGELFEILDVADDGIYTADIEYAIRPGLLLVPTLTDNRVIAYKFK